VSAKLEEEVQDVEDKQDDSGAMREGQDIMLRVFTRICNNCIKLR
jgi:hypothetical protein